MKSLEEVKKKVMERNTTKKNIIAVAVAGDLEVLETIKMINDSNIASAILVGDEEKIRKFAAESRCDLNINEVINEPDERKAAQLAVNKVREGEADILMKGLLQTKDYLKAILHPDLGLRQGKLLNMVSVFDIPNMNRLIIALDCGMILAPDIKEKIEMISNAVCVAKRLEISKPKLACIGAVETINMQMQDGIDAAILSKMAERGQIENVIIDGPLSLDLAISERSVQHKGIKSDVAGQADIILMPNIQAGNVFYKTMMYLTNSKSASIIMGTSKPVVITSRADSSDTKLNSIALAIHMSN
ncbi:phosphate butyryltransferase [Alkalibaculum sp. M08DMB]|uniref:Phosphate butyryltransferase n=1 Tax=Alkalibaculum sporogenes TaxID=2655001 RepID=A0A6A7KB79_9FIRM|nr:phosphate acyltransferase [Alkalibaculum sporogenes]MPW26541.1 phosphate butyryltransferase [Alkalibaculum sporogenes]